MDRPDKWEGQNNAGLIQSKFDELYSKHFQNQPAVLSFTHQSPSPAFPALSFPPPEPSPQSPADSSPATASVPLIHQERPGQSPEVHSAGHGGLHSDRGAPTDRAQPGALTNQQPLEGGPNPVPWSPPEGGGDQEGGSLWKRDCGGGLDNKRPGDWQGSGKFSREGPCDQRAGCRVENVSGGANLCTRGVSGSQPTESNVMTGSHSKNDTGCHTLNAQTILAAGGLSDGSLVSKVDWSQLTPGGVTVILVSPNPAVNTSHQSPNLVVNPNLTSEGTPVVQTSPSQADLQKSGGGLLEANRTSGGEATESKRQGTEGRGKKKREHGGSVHSIVKRPRRECKKPPSTQLANHKCSLMSGTKQGKDNKTQSDRGDCDKAQNLALSLEKTRSRKGLVSNLRKREKGVSNDIGLRRNVKLEMMARAAAEPVCCICYGAYDERRCYLACDDCDRWYHAETFGYSPEEAVALQTFECPTCGHTRRPFSCPPPNPSSLLASPLTVKPKLHEKLHVTHLDETGGRNAGLKEAPAEKGLGKGGKKRGLEQPPEGEKKGPSEKEAVTTRVGLAVHVPGAKLEGKKSSSEKGKKAKFRQRDYKKKETKGRQREAADGGKRNPPAPVKKRPPLRLIGGTRPAVLFPGALLARNRLEPPKALSRGGEQRTNLVSTVGFSSQKEPANGREEGVGGLQEQKASGVLERVVAVSDLASDGKLEGDRISGAQKGESLLGRGEKRSHPELFERTDLEPGRGVLGESPQKEQSQGGETTMKQRQYESASKTAPPKRIQPTRVSPDPKGGALCFLDQSVGETTRAASSDAPVLAGGSKITPHPPPLQSPGPSYQEPPKRTRNVYEPHTQCPIPDAFPVAFLGGPVFQTVNRHSWPLAYNQTMDRASCGVPLLPERIHTGAPQGKSARWSIDLSKVQEVDGRKVRMGAGLIEGVQQLS